VRKEGRKEGKKEGRKKRMKLKDPEYLQC
jgi:hypothetical protein